MKYECADKWESDNGQLEHTCIRNEDHDGDCFCMCGDYTGQGNWPDTPIPPMQPKPEPIAEPKLDTEALEEKFQEAKVKTFTLTVSDDFLDKLIQVSVIAAEDAHDAGKDDLEEVWDNFSDALEAVRDSG